MNTTNQALITINVNDPFAMRYWARQLRISESDLRAAIGAAGNTIAAVRAHIAHLSPEHTGRSGHPRA